MNKKKIIGVLLLLLSLIAMIIIVVTANVSTTVSFFSFQKSFSLSSEYSESEEFTIGIYISELDTNLSDKNSIIKSEIRDEDSSEILSVDLREIVHSNEVLTVKDKKYYLHNYIFDIKFQTTEDFTFELDNAYLNLNMENSDDIILEIGSFSFYKVESFGTEDFIISRLKGIVNILNDYSTLFAIQIGINNKNSSNIKLRRLIPLDTNIHVSNNDLKVVNGFDNIKSSDSLSLLLGYDYSVVDNRSEGVKLDINIEDRVDLLIPLKYKNEIQINKLALLIEYEIEGITKHYYYNEFTFFNSYFYSESQINDLVIYTYENH